MHTNGHNGNHLKRMKRTKTSCFFIPTVPCTSTYMYMYMWHWHSQKCIYSSIFDNRLAPSESRQYRKGRECQTRYTCMVCVVSVRKVTWLSASRTWLNEVAEDSIFSGLWIIEAFFMSFMLDSPWTLGLHVYISICQHFQSLSCSW